MGEASATDKGNTDERIKWAKYYFGKAKECSIPVILWDNMVVYPNGDDGAERHGHFNRITLSWYQPELIEAMVTAAGGKTGGSGTGDSSGDGSEVTPPSIKNLLMHRKQLQK